MTNQNNSNKLLNNIISYNRLTLWLYLLLAIAVICGIVFLVITFKTSSTSLNVDEKIDDTPICVERMRQIGEWEFLCISDEEIIDTMRKRLFKDDELIRIYTGKLRLGADMREMKDDAIQCHGDSIIVTIPDIKLLDEKFIDEAATKPFYQSGSWDGTDYELLYKKAQTQMKQHCLTRENLATARENGKAEVKKMLDALEIKNVVVK